MRTITCDKCGVHLTERTVHVLELALTNAEQTVSALQTHKSGDFCHECAAKLFRDFDEPLPRAMAEESSR